MNLNADEEQKDGEKKEAVVESEEDKLLKELLITFADSAKV